MTYRASLLTLTVLIISAGVIDAQPKKGAKAKPILRLDTDGPYAPVVSLVFSPDGNTLYAAGYDKIVRVWRLNAATGKFEHDRNQKNAILRIPISAGLQGAVNALAVSDDGKWLAVGGFGASSELIGIGLSGRLMATVGTESEKLKREQGVVYVFNTTTGKAKRLEGHTGNVTDLSFSPGRNNAPVLFSLATPRRNAEGAKKNEKVSEVIAWDVTTPKQIANLVDQPYLENLPPKLHAIMPLPGDDSPRAALALGDGRLRIWSVSQKDAQVVSTPDGDFNNMIDFDFDPATGKQTVVTGSFGKKTLVGYVMKWDVGKPQPSATFHSQPKYDSGQVSYFYFPRAIAVSPKYISTAVKDRNNRTGKFANGHIHLWTIDRLGKSVKWIKLWQDLGRAPVVASDPGGRFVAVAGKGDGQIWVFRAADAAAQANAPKQVLKSSGRPVFQVAFCEKMIDGKSHRGLRIDHDAEGGERTVFDFTANKLLPDAKGWSVAAPANAGWKITPTHLSLSVTGPGVDNYLLQWPKGNAGVPPVALTYFKLSDQSPMKIPLLAVATAETESSEPAIDLYHAGTGRQIRRFVGHLGLIRSLAFSADGRLLASASTDHTVAVWSLTDLNDIYQKHGRLAGFAVEKNKQNQLVLQKFDGIVDPTRPNQKKPKQVLKEGMVVTGVENLKQKMIQPTSPMELYNRFWITKPNTNLKLQIDGEMVNVPVVQGIDVQPPLFQLYVTEHGKQQKLEWAGWTPMGDFDLSHVDVGQVLGWHFNTGNADQPATFAPLSEYQPKDFQLYVSGILRSLVKHGNRQDARKESLKPKPDPKMVRIENQFVREPQFDLDVLVDNYEPKPGDALELQKLNAKNEWVVSQKLPLEARSHKVVMLPPQSAVHKFRVQLKSAKSHLSNIFQVRYQPPPPKLTKLGSDYVVVKKKAYTVSATVMPGNQGVPATAILQHYFRGALVKEYKFPVKNADSPSKEIVLQDGVNTFEWAAVNNNALAGYEEFETAESKRLAVVYQQTKPPEIALKTVQPFWKNGTRNKIDIAAVQGKWIVVDTPSIRIEGDISAPDNMKSAQWRFAKMKNGFALKNFDATKKSFKIDDAIPIEPGDQAVVIDVTANDGKTVSKTLHVRYEPQPVRLKFDGVPSATVFEAKFTVSGKLRPATIMPRNPYPIAMTLLVDGAERQTIKVMSDAETFQLPTLLHPGRNSLQVQMKILAREELADQTLVRTYVRPPEIKSVAIKLPQKFKAVGNLTAVVHSLTPLNKSATQVRIKTKQYIPLPETIEVQDGPMPDTYTMLIKGLPLEKGSNDIVLTVSNGEYHAKSGVQKIDVITEPKNPKIVLNKTDDVLQKRELQFGFNVYTESELKTLQILVDGVVVKTIDTTKIKLAPGKDFYQFNPDLKFAPGSQHAKVTVRAWNQDGGHTQSPAASFIIMPPPIDVQLAKVEALDANNKWVEVKQSKNRTYNNLPKGKVRVHGVVSWDDPGNIPPARDQIVEFYVNEFRHIPVHLAETGDVSKRTFTADLFLNSKTNTVRFELPKVAVDSQHSDANHDYTMVCEKPHTGKTFNVVMFAPKFDDQPAMAQSSLALKSQVESALANATGPKKYVDLTDDYYTLDDLHFVLKKLQQQVKLQAMVSESRPIVMFVYQGKQTITDDDVYLWTSDTTGQNFKRESISMSYLKQVFANELYGAQVVFMESLPSGGKRKDWLTAQLQKENVHFAAFGRLHEEAQAKPNWSKLVEELKTTMPNTKDFQELQQRIERWSKMPPTPVFDQYVPKQLKIHFTG